MTSPGGSSQHLDLAAVPQLWMKSEIILLTTGPWKTAAEVFDGGNPPGGGDVREAMQLFDTKATVEFLPANGKPGAYPILLVLARRQTDQNDSTITWDETTVQPELIIALACQIGIGIISIGSSCKYRTCTPRERTLFKELHGACVAHLDERVPLRRFPYRTARRPYGGFHK
jgi:hypothetical protein